MYKEPVFKVLVNESIKYKKVKGQYENFKGSSSKYLGAKEQMFWSLIKEVFMNTPHLATELYLKKEYLSIFFLWHYFDVK